MKMSSTVNGYGYGYNQPQGRTGYSVANKDSKGVMRGQSLNYNKKGQQNQNILFENNNRNSKYGQSTQKDSSKLANQFLTFKLENPKIVTIKK